MAVAVDKFESKGFYYVSYAIKLSGKLNWIQGRTVNPFRVTLNVIKH